MTIFPDDDEPDDLSMTQARRSLDPGLQAHIGNKLKQFYDEIVAEPIPDRFKALLDQLESHPIGGAVDQQEASQ